MTETNDYITMKATIDGVDHVACEMEQKWGVGRLRLLVNDNLRQRFDERRIAAMFVAPAGDEHSM